MKRIQKIQEELGHVEKFTCLCGAYAVCDSQDRGEETSQMQGEAELLSNLCMSVIIEQKAC